jgi:hypothetical protein
MAKRFIISEEERSDIRSKYGLINEQTELMNKNKAIQCFLNKKGIRDKENKPLKIDGSIGTLDNDSKTAQAIEKYQNILKVRPDGVWGSETYNKMPDKDVQIFKQCLSDEGDFIDKGLHFFGLD